MSNRVNPPPHIKMPKQWQDVKEIRDYLNSRDFIQFQLWKRLGGGDDIIAGLQSSENPEDSMLRGMISSLRDDLEQIEDAPIDSAPRFYAAIKNSNYTAVNGDFIEAQKKAIITLDPNANIDDQIIVANGDGSRITVLGTIKFDRPDTKLFINNQGTSLHFQYFGSYWRIR